MEGVYCDLETGKRSNIYDDVVFNDKAILVKKDKTKEKMNLFHRRCLYQSIVIIILVLSCVRTSQTNFLISSLLHSGQFAHSRCTCNFVCSESVPTAQKWFYITQKIVIKKKNICKNISGITSMWDGQPYLLKKHFR